MPAFDRETGIAFESVLFPENHMEVSYTEAPDRGEGIVRIQTLLINGPEKVPEAWAVLIEALVEFVDAARLALRDPPQAIPRG